MKRKILWGAMASFISFMIIAIALMTAMFIRMVQMTVPESSSVSPSGPYYDGLYIDLVQEADYQNYLDNGDSAVDSHIIKISNDTGYLACASASSGDLEIVYPKFVHEGVPVELRFENRVLTGYRLTYEGEIQSMLGAREQIALTEDDQTTIEDVAFELAWSDETWVTDQPSLEAVLADYMEQVDAFVAENGPHTDVTL